MLTPNQIREKRLTVVDSQGYDREEVNLFLAQVIDSYETLVNENKELYRKMDVLANRIEEYREEEASITKTLVNAQKLADKVTSDATAEAQNTIAESNASAQKIVTDANEKADKIIAEARDYVAKLTAEKNEEAQATVAAAEKRANDAINGAKVLGNAALVQADLLSKEIVAKAKAEAEYYTNLIKVIKSEAEDFTTTLTALYGAQLQKLSSIEQVPSDVSAQQQEIDEIEAELMKKLATVEEIIGVPEQEANDALAQAMKLEEEAEEEIEQESIEEEEEPVEESEEEAVNDDFEIIDDGEESDEEPDYDEVDEIIESLEKPAFFDDDDEDVEEEEIDTPPTHEEVQSALDAFTADEITPVEETAASIPEIEDEPEFESGLPFESFFNVDKNAGNTNETISLVSPDEDDDEEDDTSKFRGFFKKKK